MSFNKGIQKFRDIEFHGQTFEENALLALNGLESQAFDLEDGSELKINLKKSKSDRTFWIQVHREGEPSSKVDFTLCDAPEGREQDACLGKIQVAPQSQSQGWGGRLLKAALKVCDALRIKRIFLSDIAGVCLPGEANPDGMGKHRLRLIHMMSSQNENPDGWYQTQGFRAASRKEILWSPMHRGLESYDSFAEMGGFWAGAADLCTENRGLFEAFAEALATPEPSPELYQLAKEVLSSISIGEVQADLATLAVSAPLLDTLRRATEELPQLNAAMRVQELFAYKKQMNPDVYAALIKQLAQFEQSLVLQVAVPDSAPDYIKNLMAQWIINAVLERKGGADLEWMDAYLSGSSSHENSCTESDSIDISTCRFGTPGVDTLQHSQVVSALDRIRSQSFAQLFEHESENPVIQVMGRLLDRQLGGECRQWPMQVLLSKMDDNEDGELRQLLLSLLKGEGVAREGQVSRYLKQFRDGFSGAQFPQKTYVAYVLAQWTVAQKQVFVRTLPGS